MLDEFLKNFDKKSSLSSKGILLLYLLIGLIISVVYYPTFSGDFIFDDIPLIKNNQYIRSLKSPFSYFTQEDGIVLLKGGRHTGYYRPFINFTYFIDYKLWGLKGSGFRITNLILHFISCATLFYLLMRITNHPLASFVSVMVFAVHPVNTEAVSWVSSRNNILVTIFGLISFYLYFQWLKEDRKNWKLYTSWFFFSLSILSKEFGLLILPFIFICRTVVIKKPISKDEIYSYIPFLLISLLYFSLRFHVIGSIFTPVSAERLWTRIYYAPYIVAFDLRLLFPYGLHRFNIQYPEDYISYKAIIGIICFIGIIVIAYYIYKRDKITFFGILSFFLGLLTVLNIIPTSSVSLISMRWLYFPFAFLCISFAKWLTKFIQKRFVLVIISSVVIIIYLGIYSFYLNRYLWHDEDTFYLTEIISLKNYDVVGSFAERLSKQKKYTESEKWFKIAIDKYPSNAKNFINYASLLLETSRPNEAVKILKKCLFLKMNILDRAGWYNNMGVAYFKMDRLDLAVKFFQKAIKLAPYQEEYWANLGSVYGKRRNFTSAINAFKMALSLNPDSVNIKRSLALAYYKDGKRTTAVKILETIPRDLWKKYNIHSLYNIINQNFKRYNSSNKQ